jgi:protein-tyrosine phosphatase
MLSEHGPGKLPATIVQTRSRHSTRPMDWFTTLTGFPETHPAHVRSQLWVDGERLYSRVNGRSYGIGRLTTPSLGQLRVLGAQALPAVAGTLEVTAVAADVRALLGEASHAGAVFQVASQFNLLEMVSPEVTPEMGVTRYAGDPTQGPACAIAAGAATIYRNYFAPVRGGEEGAIGSAAPSPPPPPGQTAQRQIDCAADLRDSLSQPLGMPPSALWAMINGYALPSASGLAAVDAHLAACAADAPDALDALRAQLRIGLHEDVEVTHGQQTGHLVTQVFGSAMPVAYSGLPAAPWERLARLVLQASYEATLWAAVVQAARTGQRQVFLTLLGGGAFGNPRPWILEALQWALARVAGAGLQVAIVSHGGVPADLARAVASWGAVAVPMAARPTQRAVRTSLTDPLQIAEVSVQGAATTASPPGLIGITFCPGKQGDSVFGRPWQRDLAADLDVVQRWGAETVVSLIEDHEFRLLGVSALGAMVLARGMSWLHLPIPDMQPPGPRFEAEWADVRPQLRAVLHSGGRVLVHCRGGLGRAGTVAARVLIDLGHAPEDAIQRVRVVRPGAIETAAQEAYLRGLAARR